MVRREIILNYIWFMYVSLQDKENNDEIIKLKELIKLQADQAKVNQKQQVCND